MGNYGSPGTGAWRERSRVIAPVASCRIRRLTPVYRIAASHPELHWQGADLRLYKWRLEPNTQGVGFVCVAISDSVMCTAADRLHARTADAVATLGRSEVERVLGEVLPPRRIEVHRDRPPRRDERGLPARLAA
jgi:hypothetical protein